MHRFHCGPLGVHKKTPYGPMNLHSGALRNHAQFRNFSPRTCNRGGRVARKGVPAGHGQTEGDLVIAFRAVAGEIPIMTRQYARTGARKAPPQWTRLQYLYGCAPPTGPSFSLALRLSLFTRP